MKRSALLLLGAAMAAISCTVSATGLAVTAEDEDGGANPGSVVPGPAGFAGLPEDGGAATTIADAAPASPVAPPAMADAAPPAPATTPPVTTPPVTTPPAEPRVLRVHDVKVGRLTARVVHAHQLEAAAGSAGRVLPPDADALLKLELGAQDLEVDELTVDVLFAHDIKAGRVQLEETHARVKMPGKGHED